MQELLLNLIDYKKINPKFGWVQAAPYPTNMRGAACATINGKIYFFGGTRPKVGDEPYANYTYPNVFRVFDPKDGTYTNLVGTPPGRSRGFACQFNNKFYLIGGGQNTLVAIDSQLWMFDPVDSTWTAYPGISGTFYVNGITTTAGYIWCTRYNTTSQRTELHRWNPASPSSGWTKMTDLPVAQLNNGPIMGNGNAIYYFGGRIGGGAGSNALWYYNISTNGWTALNPLPTSSDNFRAVLVNGKMFLVTTTDTSSMPIYLFNGTNCILQTQLPPLPLAAVDGGLSVVDSDIHYIGGYSSDATPAGSIAQHAIYTTG